ncbi:hypothetical protein AA313_de0208363 [Arthrobotrys entomopaga]|nr:hypothetical protein AA313_de0208363 [Arthrobotrys entomopaga]
MHPQLKYASRKSVQDYQSSRIHPYATYSPRYAKFLPSHDPVDEPIASSNDALNCGQQKGNEMPRKHGRKVWTEAQQDVEDSEGQSNGNPKAQGSIAESNLAVQAWLNEIPSFEVGHGEVSSTSDMPLQPQQDFISTFLGPPNLPHSHFSAVACSPMMQSWTFFQTPSSYQAWMNSGYGLPSFAPVQPSHQNGASSGAGSSQQYHTTSIPPSQSFVNNTATLERRKNFGRKHNRANPRNQNQKRSSSMQHGGSSNPVRPPSSNITILNPKDRHRMTVCGENPLFVPSAPDQETDHAETDRYSINKPRIEIPDFVHLGSLEKEIKLPLPQPTAEYLDLANEPNKLLPTATGRRLLVILDVNGTLLCRRVLPNGCRDRNNPIKRRYLQSFLHYLFTEHEVAIFSSAMQNTVLRLLKGIIPEADRDKILQIFTREDMGLPKELFRAKVSTFKRLSMIWDSLKTSDPELQFDQTNTVLVEDTPEKAASEPYNLVKISEYTMETHRLGQDNTLAQVAGYLEVLRKYENVSSYIRKAPFQGNEKYSWPRPYFDFRDDSNRPKFREVSREIIETVD